MTEMNGSPGQPQAGMATMKKSSVRRQQRLVAGLSHVVLLIFTVIVVYPVFWMVIGSLKSGYEMSTNIWGFPKTFMWENYPLAWEQGMLGQAFLNSLFVSIGVVGLIVVFASLAGYAFAKMQFKGSMIIFLFFVFTMQAGPPIVALYVMIVKLHLSNTYAGLILPTVAGGLPLSIFVFRAFFQGIPDELIDAAKVDGCTELHAFLRVVAPISGPAVATVGILQWLGAWNDFTMPLILVRTPDMRTLPLTIANYQWEFGRTDWALVFACLTISSLPMILLYVLMQRQFIQGLTSGSLKG